MSKQESCVVCTFGAPVLRKKASLITEFGAPLEKKADHMLQVMYTANGIGLAAPQIGESIQLVVIDLQLDKSEETVILDGRTLPLQLVQPFCFVNPHFEPVNDVKISEEEGCLSLPDVRGNVNRFHEIKLTYQDLCGGQHVLQCRNLFARCIQHECDHLRGILFIDHLSKTERKDNQALLNDIKALGGQFDYATLEDE